MKASNSPTADHRETPYSLATKLPAARRVLSWLYAGRLILIFALFVQATGRLLRTGPALEVVVGAMLPLTALITFLSYWHTHHKRRPVGEAFLYTQLIFDALLLTLAVHVTGGSESAFAPLYILLMSVASLVLSARGGILIGALAIALYLGSSVWSAGGVIQSSVLLQLGLFVLVALVTAYLGSRLRAAGAALDAALGEIQSELAQLKLDTGDILNTMHTGVLTVDDRGCLVYINPFAEEMLDLPADRSVGAPVLERLDKIAPGLGEVIERSAHARTAIRRYETRPVNEDSFILGVSTTLVDRLDGGGSVVTAIFQDITEKKRVEGLRRRSERLEAVAALSASLAHEIKNPLASIRSSVEQIADGRLDHADNQLLRALVVRESDRLSRLLSEFIDFARVEVATPEPVDFLETVRESIDLVRSHPDAEGREVSLLLDGSPEEMWIRGASDLIHRAIFNLILNAVQWSGENGEVRLTLSVVRSDLLSPAMGALSLLRLTVTDSGPGVPEGIIDNIFDPFFTRRPGGTGLGLALVQRAVEAHSGAIFVDNSIAGKARGATFTMYLPALAEPRSAAAMSQNERYDSK